MANYTQETRPMAVTTPLGKDVLLLVGFAGQEAISHLFDFQLDLIAENKTDISFDQLLGQKIAIGLKLPDGKERYFSGICSRFSQGQRDETFTHYRMEVVPQFWLLTRRVQSRIFQHMSVPDILKKVLTGLDFAFELHGTFQPRDYCVQYRESDFAFASRLMEEEGIYYFFKHSADGHKMVLANSPQSHADVPGATQVIYEEVIGGNRPEDRVHEWEVSQEIRPGKYTLWDHCFELPGKHLEADRMILDKVQVGMVNHALKVGGNDKLEIYDYPGGYAERFDGISPGGGERPADVQKIFEDNKRTVEIRMQQEALPGLVIDGTGSCRQFVAGHKFTLERHFNADGPYVITRVEHQGNLPGSYSSGGDGAFTYSNNFQCIPLSLPYRPLRTTPRPVVEGTQTAVVVGPAGEEIFTDKYGRVKVQFHWDRQGKHNADSSCWIRVAQAYAGKGWGSICVPRIGQEVIVDFLEGNPDCPIITGRVYNAEQMPPYALPANQTQSGIKTRSSLGGTPENFNEIRFEDKKGSEMLTVHAEKDQAIGVEHDEAHWVGHDRTKTIDHDETSHIKHDRTETVDNNETISIGNNRTESVGGNETIAVAKNRARTVSQNETVTVSLTRTHTVGVNEAITVGAAQEVSVGGFRTVTVGAYQAVTVGGYQAVTVGANHSETIGSDRNASVGKNIAFKAGQNFGADAGQSATIKCGKNLLLEAGDEIMMRTGDASIYLKKDGTVEIQGKDITLKATGKINEKADGDITIKGSKINAN
jgi:type VI secretion system secreted protein VgrG